MPLKNYVSYWCHIVRIVGLLLSLHGPEWPTQFEKPRSLTSPIFYYVASCQLHGQTFSNWRTPKISQLLQWLQADPTNVAQHGLSKGSTVLAPLAVPRLHGGARRITRGSTVMGRYDYDEDEKRPWSPGGFTQIYFMAGFNVKTCELLHRLIEHVSNPKSCVNVNRSWRVQCLKCWHVTIAALFFPFYHLRFRFISTYHTSSDFFWRFTSFPVVRAESKIHSQQSIIHGVRTKKTLHWVDLGWQDGGTGFGRRFRHHHRRWGRSQRCRSSNHLGAGLVDMSWCGGT